VPENGLLAWEGISRVMNDVPDIRRVARARLKDCAYIPTCTRKRGDVVHFHAAVPEEE
jgi:hypothetical protein